MSRRYKVRTPEKVYFITVTIVNWVDVFTLPKQKQLIIDSLKYCQKEKGLEIFGYVLMSNHLHMLCRAKKGHDLVAIIRDFKKFTSRNIIKNICNEPESSQAWMMALFSNVCAHLKRGQDYKVWQDGYHGIEIFSPIMFQQKLKYIHDNPVKKHIVEKPEDYHYSSARNYAELEAPLEVIVVR